MRLKRAIVAALLVSALPLTAAAPASAAPTEFFFTGSGWGHSVGMSQYGAYGQALEGRTAAQILAHYYRGTTLGAADDAALIRVSLISDTSRAQIRGKGGNLTVIADAQRLTVPPGRVLDVTFSNAGTADSFEDDRVVLSDGTTTLTVAQVQVVPDLIVEVVGPTEGYNFDAAGQEYRYGLVDVRPNGGNLEVVNQLKMNEYMRGIAEVPSSWPGETLRAQAIASRTYAHRARGGQEWQFRACLCHVYDTVQSQVFAGYVKETGPGGANWVAAADGTVGQVVLYEGKLATTLYSSSTGGRTQNTWDRFGGSPQDFPYLSSVDDRWSLAPYNPYSAWEYTKTQAEVAAAFGLPDVERLDLSDRTDAGALRNATAFSSSGASRTITGGTFVDRLGLRSRFVGTPVIRVKGANRFATAVEIGRLAAPTGATVVVVSGQSSNLVDGLVAGPLARSKSAPVLLTNRDALPTETSRELDRRRATTAFIVGGQSAVGAGVERALTARGMRVARLSGGDRYETAKVVAEAMPAKDSAVVASGAPANLVDALAAGAPAASAGQPILLTDPRTLPASTRAALQSRAVRSTIVVGGESAVSREVMSQLPSPTRLSGGDRYATAAAVANHYGPIIGETRAAVASGENANLVDALAGGALGGHLLLTTAASLPGASRDWLRPRTDSLRRVNVLGGRSAVSDAAYDEVRATVYP